MKTSVVLFLGVALCSFAVEPSGANREGYGPKFKPAPHFRPGPRHGPRKDIDPIRSWNEIAIDASGFDHANAKEQLGPCRASRALAIVHIAMFDSVVAVLGGYESYTGVQAPSGPVSVGIAVSQAARDTLVALFPSQAAKFDAFLAEDLARCRSLPHRANGVTLGKAAAAAILALRSNDGSQHTEPALEVGHFTSDDPGRWRKDPISMIPIALGAKWGDCTTFVLESSDQFRIPPPPALTSPEYAAAFDEVRRLGGVASTERTEEQTQIGIYWAYDGTPSLCAPPRLYNQIALQIADQMRSSDIEVARLLALVNVAMADAGMAVWDSKYHYDFWRPVTGIREADPGTGPGPNYAGDGNAATVGDTNFTPLGAPASNLMGPNFTPPFPAYPSGHAGFGGALFQTLRRFYKTDKIRFTFVSDEYNGITIDNNTGKPRPLIPRTFRSLSQAEEENGQSRIYLGIHWSFDKTEGIAQGRKVGDYVFDNVFRPVRRRGNDR